MSRIILAAALAAFLGACASVPATTAQIAEKADTDASLSYAAIASSVNAYEALGTTGAVQAASAEALKLQAWNLLGQERQAYALGRTFDPAGLQALVTQATQLGH